MSDQRPEPARADGAAVERSRERPYRKPELQEYGSLRELTRTLSNLTPGDGLGGSFAT